MAHKEGQYIYTDEDTLGEYEFYVMSSADPVANKTYIHAQCKKGDAIAVQSAEVAGVAELISFHVDANDTTADVYASVRVPIHPEEGEYTSDLDTSPLSQPIEGGTSLYVKSVVSGSGSRAYYYEHEHTGGIFTAGKTEDGYWYIVAGQQDFTAYEHVVGRYARNDEVFEDRIATVSVYQHYIHAGKTVSFLRHELTGSTVQEMSIDVWDSGNFGNVGEIAWTMVYGTAVDPEYEEQEILVGRFAIDLEDAGGTGEDSDWEDPGDEDPGDDPDDPTYTLHLDVTGALSGRHNDPLNDTSYSYIPADKATVKDYGCGGDGGHGGGGGGGASTVVVHKFATSRASSKEIIAKARRHGYGSGGGKGGKGGDGCILIYY